MKRDLVKLVGGILVGGVAIVGLLPACSGAAGGTATAPPPPQATATSQPTTTTPTPVPTPSTMLPNTPVPAPPGNGGNGDLLAQGKLIFEKTAGGIGCQACHGIDARGGTSVGAPDIRGRPESQVREALVGVEMMSIIKLTDAEIEAVVAYLQYLNEQM